ncbi:9579_t:CDS:2 [Entrophospora sp. SA101]|nr:9579_t:CDS:2 [Entrophospora sp. SA101]
MGINKIQNPSSSDSGDPTRNENEDNLGLESLISKSNSTESACSDGS